MLARLPTPRLLLPAWRRLKEARRTALLRSLPQGGVAVELGVWEGSLSERITRIVQPGELHLVDAWAYTPHHAQAWMGDGVAGNQEYMDAMFERVQRRVPAAIFHRTHSVKAASEFTDGSVDWVYVDASHIYEDVKADLEVWAPKVRPGGLILGDDYTKRGWWQGGVKAAVDEFVDQPGYRLRRPVWMRQFIIDVG